MTLGRRGELLRRMQYARAELTPGLERRQARRAAYEARYGPCVGDIEGALCPLHGVHESSRPEPDDETTTVDRVLFWVPLLLMLGVAATAIVWDWPLLVGAASIIVAGPVVYRVLCWVRGRWQR
jgi:hypothetical protein